MNHINNIDDLIAKVLAGEANSTEKELVSNWRQIDESNEAYYKSLEKVFALSSKLSPSTVFNTDKAWEQVRKSVRGENSQNGNVKHFYPSFTGIIFRIAAMVLIAAGLSYTAYKVFTPLKSIQEHTFTTGETFEDLSLPDSSSVTLNKNSELQLSYDENKRMADLTGEAFFELADDPRPFILSAGTLTITDIGTSFNVNAPVNSDSVIVIVTNGEVLIKTQGETIVDLSKGDQAIYLKSRDTIIKSVVTDTNALAYKTRIFVFDNTQLEVIVDKLNEVYNSSILLSDNLYNCKLTATFKNESIENIIDVIAETLNFEIEKKNNNIILKGNSCE